MRFKIKTIDIKVLKTLKVWGPVNKTKRCRKFKGWGPPRVLNHCIIKKIYVFEMIIIKHNDGLK
jgi:hypothetical protein